MPCSLTANSPTEKGSRNNVEVERGGGSRPRGCQAWSISPQSGWGALLGSLGTPPTVPAGLSHTGFLSKVPLALGTLPACLLDSRERGGAQASPRTPVQGVSRAEGGREGGRLGRIQGAPPKQEPAPHCEPGPARVGPAQYPCCCCGDWGGLFHPMCQTLYTCLLQEQLDKGEGQSVVPTLPRAKLRLRKSPAKKWQSLGSVPVAQLQPCSQPPCYWQQAWAGGQGIGRGQRLSTSALLPHGALFVGPAPCPQGVEQHHWPRPTRCQ